MDDNGEENKNVGKGKESKPLSQFLNKALCPVLYSLVTNLQTLSTYMHTECRCSILWKKLISMKCFYLHKNYECNYHFII